MLTAKNTQPPITGPLAADSRKAFLQLAISFEGFENWRQNWPAENKSRAMDDLCRDASTAIAAAVAAGYFKSLPHLGDIVRFHCGIGPWLEPENRYVRCARNLLAETELLLMAEFSERFTGKTGDAGLQTATAMRVLSGVAISPDEKLEQNRLEEQFIAAGKDLAEYFPAYPHLWTARKMFVANDLHILSRKERNEISACLGELLENLNRFQIDESQIGPRFGLRNFSLFDLLDHPSNWYKLEAVIRKYTGLHRDELSDLHLCDELPAYIAAAIERAEHSAATNQPAELRSGRDENEPLHGVVNDHCYWHSKKVELPPIPERLLCHLWNCTGHSDTDGGALSQVWGDDDGGGEYKIHSATSKIRKAIHGLPIILIRKSGRITLEFLAS